MISNRIITFILGIIMIISGVFCLFNPEMTYMGVGYAAGINMVISAIAGIFLWFEIKRVSGSANGWALAGAIASLVLGVLVIGNSALQIALDMTIIYFIATWLVIGGIISIVLSFRVRNMRKEANMEYLGKNWWLMTITGILLVICGIYSLFNPSALITTIGVNLGLAIIVVGANAVASVA